MTLVATIKPDNAEDMSVTWTSSDEDILMVNKNGKVVCLGYGGATITATTNDGSNLSASCHFDCGTGIDGVENHATKREIYSVTCVKRTKTQKGVNIVNGKKVLVK